MEIFNAYIKPSAEAIAMINNQQMGWKDIKSVGQGRNLAMTTLFNIAMTIYSLDNLEKTLREFTRFKEIPYQNILSFGVPISIACLVHCEFKNIYLRKVVNIAFEHTATISKIITVVTILALFSGGQYVSATAATIGMVVYILDDQEILPTSIRQRINASGFIIACVYDVAFGSGFFKILGL